MTTKDGFEVTRGRYFRLLREVRDEDDEGFPTVVHGGANDLVIATGNQVIQNAFEVISTKPLNHPEINEFLAAPFMVTLDDVVSVDAQTVAADFEFYNTLLNEYDRKQKHIRSEISKSVLEVLADSDFTKEDIILLLDILVEQSESHYALWYWEDKVE